MEINKNNRQDAKLIWPLLYFIFFLTPSFGQQFLNPYFIGAPNADATILDVIQTEDTTYLYGTYKNAMSVDGIEIGHHNMLDVFLVKRVNGVAEWVFYGGSNGVDEAGGMGIDADQNIVIGGSFWNEAMFGSTTLISSGSSKAIFVLRISPDGQLIDPYVINGTGTKNIAGIAIVDEDIYVNGDFGGTLFTSITEAIAQAELDIFLLKLNKAGDAEWISHYGIEGKNDAIDFSWQEDQEQFIVSGQMNGTIAIPGDTIQTNTFDEDVYVAAFDKQGQGKWISKAGGQYDDFTNAHCTDDEGNIYLTGTYRGIINLDDGTQINTGGILNVDSYIIKFDASGNNLWAHSLGGTPSTEVGTDISFGNNKIYWTGYYSDLFSIDQIVYSQPTGVFSGAVGVFDKDGQINNGFSVNSTTIVVPLGILPVDENAILYGDFSGRISLDQEYDLGDKIYGFAVELRDIKVSTLDHRKTGIAVFPNPVGEILNIKFEGLAQDVTLYNVAGKVMYNSEEKRLEHQIDVSRMVDGIYFWSSDAGYSGKVVKK